MCALISNQGPRRRARKFGAPAIVALALSAPAGVTAVLAQTPPSAPVPVKLASGPKQAGAWAITGWARGADASHCSADRQVRGLAAAMTPLQFAIVRFSGGYRIALSSQDWELKPQTAFPIELAAQPVLTASTKAFAVAAKTVVIDLGTDWQLMQKLNTAPMIEVKAARTAFKLPLDGFAEMLPALDSCYAALKRTSAPAPAVIQAKSDVQAKDPQAKTLQPKNDVKHDATPVGPRADDEFVEEHTFLTVPGAHGPYRLEALVVRPAKATGRLPIALITHGKNATAAENQSFRADMMLPQARDFAARGWLAVAVIRRGYGLSDGIPGVPRAAAYMSCQNADLVRGFELEADDLDGALKAVAARPDADGTRAIAVGQSLGGGTVLAFAARQPAGLVGVVNVSGGVLRTDANGVCDHADLVAAMASFGGRTRVPSLWLYAENDSLFPPALVTRMREAYAEAGGRPELRMFPAVLYDGHRLFADFAARVQWLRALDTFLQANNLPNINVARVDEVMTAVRLPAGTRAVVEQYFSTPMPKVLVATASGKGAYWAANSNDIEGARRRVLSLCREKTGADCTVIMENNALVRPIVTGAITPQTTTR
jgi:dienelactone hydrolase